MSEGLSLESRKVQTQNCAPIQWTVWSRNVKYAPNLTEHKFTLSNRFQTPKKLFCFVQLFKLVHKTILADVDSQVFVIQKNGFCQKVILNPKYYCSVKEHVLHLIRYCSDNKKPNPMLKIYASFFLRYERHGANAIHLLF